MKLAPYSVLVLILVMVGSAYSVFDNDPFMKCMYENFCLEPKGEERLAKCRERFSDKDREYSENFYRQYLKLHEHATLRDMLDVGCKDPEHGKDGINQFYEELKKKKDRTKREDEQVMEARACMLAFVENCLFKKSMGFVYKT